MKPSLAKIVPVQAAAVDVVVSVVVAAADARVADARVAAAADINSFC